MVTPASDPTPASDSAPRRTFSRRAIAAGAAAVAGLEIVADRNGIVRAGMAATPPSGAIPEATPGATPAGSPTATRPAIIVRVEMVGGFVASETYLTATPSYQLTDDGTEISQGAQIAIYPPPALPSLQAATLTGAGIQAVLAAATAAGLTNGDQESANPDITDLPTQVITVMVDGRRATTTAYGLEQLNPADTSELAAARDRIRAFLSVILTPASLRPVGQVAEPETFYAFSELQIVAVPADELPAAQEQGTLEGATPAAPVAWPLATPLSDFGIPLSEAAAGGRYAGAFAGARVDTIGGPDLDAILPLAQQANQLTRWESDGSQWILLLRPLLPGEVGNLARPADAAAAGV